MISILADNAAELYSMIKSGGPFVVVFCLIYAAIYHFYFRIIKPSREVDLAISNNQAKATNDLKEMSRDLKEIASDSKEAMLEIKAMRDEKRRAAMVVLATRTKDPLHDT